MNLVLKDGLMVVNIKLGTENDLARIARLPTKLDPVQHLTGDREVVNIKTKDTGVAVVNLLQPLLSGLFQGVCQGHFREKGQEY